VHDFVASEYFTNIFGLSGLSDLLQAHRSMACQPSLEMNLDYICHESNTDPLRREPGGPLARPEKASNPSSQQPLSKDISLSVPDAQLQLQLRSASRKSKNRKSRSAAPSNQAHARESPNFVEKHYRARLKTQFERLLTVLPAAQACSLADRDTTASLDRVLSRGQVLDMARNHILELVGKIEFILNKKRNGYHISTHIWRGIYSEGTARKLCYCNCMI
jgi:hypothetical protein